MSKHRYKMDEIMDALDEAEKLDKTLNRENWEDSNFKEEENSFRATVEADELVKLDITILEAAKLLVEKYQVSYSYAVSELQAADGQWFRDTIIDD